MGKDVMYLDMMKSLLPAPLGEQLRPHARIAMRQPGHIIMGYGDRTSDVYLILDGHVRAELHSPNGREVTLGDLGPGELFGELSALDDHPRSATVVVTSRCVLASLPGAAFREAVFANPEAAAWMSRQLVSRIRLITEKIYELNALAVRNRLHCELLRLGLAAGIVDNRAVILSAPTHAQLAARIGTHREAVTRELQYLMKQAIVVQQGRQLAINDIAQLAQIVRAVTGDMDIIQRATPVAS